MIPYTVRLIISCASIRLARFIDLPVQRSSGILLRTAAFPGIARLLTSYVILFVLTAFPALAEQPPSIETTADLSCPPGLVHYFGMDEKATGSYLDFVSGASASCITCPAPASSNFAGGQRFNGSSTGLQFNDIQRFQWGPNSSFTIEVWVQLAGSTSNNQVIAGRKANENLMAWWLGVSSEGYAVFDMQDNLGEPHRIGDYLRAKNLFDGKWHHIAVVRDGINEITKLYVDGFRVDERVAEKKVYRGSLESASPLTIGYLEIGNGFHFNGILDEFQVYNRNLSEQEMRARYNNGAGSYCGPELLAPVIVSDPITYGVVGQTYMYQVRATGKPQPNFTLSGAPQGMTINATTGLITWVPQATGNFDVRVRATNSQGDDEQAFRIAVKQGNDEKVGMMHHWMLQETAGSRYSDFYTPFDAIAETKSRPAPVKGAVGGGQRFNGENTGLDVNGSPNFNWRADESFSIELWMKTEVRKNHNQVLIGRDGKDSPVHWWVGVTTDGKAAFVLRDITFVGIDLINSGPALNTGSWRQIVAVRDGATGISKLFVDGEKVAEGRHTFTNEFSSRTHVNIGYMNSSILNTYHYEGDLDEVKLFGRALSEVEVKERYQEVFDGLTEFLTFTGRYTSEGVVLDWQTLNEIQSDYFEVERAADGEAFEVIGNVKASGTTSAAINYTFTDESPLKERGHYRIKMYRTDGTFIYSNTILLQDRSPIASSFLVYPNPAAAGEEVRIEIANLKENEEVNFMVTDLSGRRILSEQVRTNDLGELYLTLPVGGNMRPGIYNLTVTGSNKMLNRKLVVSK